MRLSTIRSARFILLTLILPAIALLIISPLKSARGQSGRAQLPESKKQKPESPKLPEPLPRIRLPEIQQQKSDDRKEGQHGKRRAADVARRPEHHRRLLRLQVVIQLGQVVIA